MNVFKRAKLIFIIFIALFIFYVTSDFNTVNIEKTALIVAMGVDKAENEYEITVQIAVPQATDKGQGNAESVISAKGNSIYTAVEKISEQTGWHPRLSFCNLILIGENLLTENLLNLTDFFIRMYKIEDSAILCAVEGKAKSVLLATSPLDNVSSFALTKIFVREFDNASSVVTSTVKNFSVSGYSKSSYGYMPLVKMVKTEDKTDVKPSSLTLSNPHLATALNSKNSRENPAKITANKPFYSQNGGVGGESGSSGDKSSGSSGGDKPCVFDATTTLLFNNGYYVGRLNGEQSLFYSLLTKNVSEGYFSINSIDQSGNYGTFVLSVTGVKNSVNFILNGETPALNCNLSLWLKIADSNANHTVKDFSNLGRLSPQMLLDAQNYVTQKLADVFSVVQNSSCDLFSLKSELYRRYPKKYQELSQTVKLLTKPIFTVKCHNYS